ncbi:hypothetical protein [Microtetraspora niveoalba]|uniref:hypothetical protein n=1 Tax=Microtetraspora niveoalba TaxID=46175 RepID=UPI0014712327|nr:hypothetical protein [Microtetraspora niveoalba]
MLAPAILALGLLAGELAGYGDPVPGSRAVAAGRRPPPQPHTTRRTPPALLYQALVPLYQGLVPRPLVQRGPRRPLSPEAPSVRQRARSSKKVPPRVRIRPPARTGERKSGELSCEREWQDTWLWELCQERAQRSA